MIYIPTLGILYSEREVIKIQEWLGRYQNFFEIVLGQSKEKPFSGLSTEERPEPGFYKHNRLIRYCSISFIINPICVITNKSGAQGQRIIQL